MSEIAVLQQSRGKDHIRYIHDKAMKLLKYRFENDETSMIDALKEAMRQHRMYLIAIRVSNRKREIKPDFKEGSWWYNQKIGLWEKLD